jgi:hypothetical protein
MPFGLVSILSPWCDAAFLHSQDPQLTLTAFGGFALSVALIRDACGQMGVLANPRAQVAYGSVQH